MKKATVRELRNQFRSVLQWVEESISKHGETIARLVPKKPKAHRADWFHSAALYLERKTLPVLTAEQVKSLLADSQGSF